MDRGGVGCRSGASDRPCGILDTAGAFTEKGRALRTDVEEMTDRLASDVWEAMDEPSREHLFDTLRRLATLLESPDGIGF